MRFRRKDTIHALVYRDATTSKDINPVLLFIFESLYFPTETFFAAYGRISAASGGERSSTTSPLRKPRSLPLAVLIRRHGWNFFRRVHSQKQVFDFAVRAEREDQLASVVISKLRRADFLQF